jgi:hypothetical protein
MANELDLQLIEQFTQGFNMPLASQAGYVARAVAGEDADTVGIEYAPIAEAVGVAGLHTTQATSFTTIGGFALTAAEAERLAATGVKMRVLAQTSAGADACEVRLFNQTAAAAVTSSTLSFAATSFAEKTTAELALPSTAAVYLVQMRLATTGSPNTASCLRAQLEVA